MKKLQMNEQMDSSTIEQMYALYQKDADSLDESWQNFFKGVEFSQSQSQSQFLGSQSHFEIPMNKGISENGNGNGLSDIQNSRNQYFQYDSSLIRLVGHLYCKISKVYNYTNL